MTRIPLPQIIKSEWLETVIYYSFIFLFLTVSLIPFQILEIKIKNVPFQYIYIGGFAAVLAVLSFLRNPKLTVFDKWLIFLVIGFSLSLITSVDCIYTIRVLIGFFLKGIFVAFISDRILKDRVKTTNVILIVCASLIAFVGIVELFFGWHLYYKPGEMPPQIVTSTLGNPLSLAAYLLLFLPLSFLYIENKKSFIKFLPFLFITATILLSFSRSGWIALFFIIVIYFLGKGSLKKKFKNWVHAVSLVFVIVLVFFLIPQLCRNQFKDKFNVKMFSSASFEHRLKSYITTKNILKDYPLFGVGLGNYPKVHEKYMVEGVHKDTPTPDNMYLRFLCDTGIIGAGTFFVFIIYWMYQLWKKRDNPIIWAVFCGLIGFLINQLTADLFLWSATQFAFWMLLGWGVGLTNEKI